MACLQEKTSKNNAMLGLLCIINFSKCFLSWKDIFLFQGTSRKVCKVSHCIVHLVKCGYDYIADGWVSVKFWEHIATSFFHNRCKYNDSTSWKHCMWPIKLLMLHNERFQTHFEHVVELQDAPLVGIFFFKWVHLWNQEKKQKLGGRWFCWFTHKKPSTLHT